MAKSSAKKQKSTSSDLESKASSEPSEQMILTSSEGANSGLEDLFLDSIKDIYWAENHLVKNLPKMVKAAASKELQSALSEHWNLTKVHVDRLEQIFELLGKKKQAQKCDAMEGLAIEGEAVIENTTAGTSARDTGLIMASQKVEHYEIATYGGLAKLAKTIGREDIAAILGETLTEEKEADALLTTIAESM
ncbi:MAG: ferritin-like domain-containing protein [Chitinophagaceae bacterium]